MKHYGSKTWQRLIAALLVVILLAFQAPMIGAQGSAQAALRVAKYVSLDGGATWHDASAAPGPQAAVGTNISYKVVVTNAGGQSLTNLVLTDSQFSTSTCVVPATLAPAAFFECNFGPVAAAAGQHTNVATAQAAFTGGVVTASDTANYFGVDQPLLNVEKYVSLNGGAMWLDADAAPGPQAVTGANVSFKFVVTNQGTQPLSGIVLTDDKLNLTGCVIPPSLAPQASFECVVGPVPASGGAHVNTVIVSAFAGPTPVTDADQAHYTGGAMVRPFVIVIEGPIEDIDDNIIVVYDLEIELNPADPILATLNVGDWVRIQGRAGTDQDATLIVAQTVIIIDANVDIDIPDDDDDDRDDDGDDDGWRDDDNCKNPPPSWASAWGWRRKCGGTDKPRKK